MGRHKTKGNRTAGGRKKKASTVAEREAAGRVLPTPETVAYIDRRFAYWAHPAIWNRASAEHCFDNAGILWATGWFNGHGFEAEAIRQVLRDYAALYWQWYPAPKTSNPERVSRGEPGIDKAKWEVMFMRLDERLKIGTPERKAVHEIAVDGWHSDGFDPRAVALSNLGRLKLAAHHKVSLPIAGQVAHERGRERDWLDAALRGAFLLLDGKLPAREMLTPLWALNDWDKKEVAA